MTLLCVKMHILNHEIFLRGVFCGNHSGIFIFGLLINGSSLTQ